MKAATPTTHKGKGDFYTSTLAPVDCHRGRAFGVADAIMLIVLFLEIAVVTRLFLAN